MQRGRHGLSHVDVARYHRSIDRRANHRVIEIRLRHRQRRFLLGDLRVRLRHVCLCPAHSGIRGIVIRLCQIQLLLTRDSAFCQLHSTLVVRFGLHERGFRFLKIRLRGNQVSFRVFHVRARLLHRSLEQRGIDQRDEVPLVHPGIKVHKKFRDGSGDLRAHLHGDDRVDGSGGFHDVVDIAPIHFGGEVLRLRRVV